jgi:hypothetical protein
MEFAICVRNLPASHAASSVEHIRAAAPAGSSPRTAFYLRLMTADVLHGDGVRYDGMANYHRKLLAQGLASYGDIVARTTLSRDDLGAARARLDEYRGSGLDTICTYLPDDVRRRGPPGARRPHPVTTRERRRLRHPALARGRDDRLGVTTTGSLSHPRTLLVCAMTAFGQSTSQSLNRWRTSSGATRPPTSATGAVSLSSKTFPLVESRRDLRGGMDDSSLRGP